jgi:ribosomal protein L11 methyltransferase
VLASVVARSGGAFRGCETRESGAHLEMLCYLDADSSPRLREEVLDALEVLPGVEILGHETVSDRDWLVRYRELAQSVRIGRFVFDPREPEARATSPSAGYAVEQEPAGAGAPSWCLRIPARQAFGTGSHASTALLVELLERCASAVQGARVLDVGTGSGILSFVALLLGAREVHGFDLDVQAVFVAAQNRALNRLAPSFFAGSSRALRPEARYELIVANVIPEQLEGEERRLARHLAPRGLLLLSGLLADRLEGVTRAWSPLGLEVVATHGDGEWTALALARAGASTAAARASAASRASRSTSVP